MATRRYEDRLRDEYEEPLPFSYFRPQYAARYRTKALAGRQPLIGRGRVGAGVLTGVSGAALRDFGRREAARAAALQTLGHRLEVGRLREERKDELKRFLEADAAREATEKAKHRRKLAEIGVGQAIAGLALKGGQIVASEGQAGELPHQRFSLSAPEEDDQDSGPSRPRVRYEPGVGLGLEYPAFSVQDPELEVPERSFEDLLMGVGNGF